MDDDDADIGDDHDDDNAKERSETKERSERGPSCLAPGPPCVALGLPGICIGTYTEQTTDNERNEIRRGIKPAAAADLAAAATTSPHREQ